MMRRVWQACIAILFLGFAACDPASSEDEPTLTPPPVLTPTPVPTPVPATLMGLPARLSCGQVPLGQSGRCTALLLNAGEEPLTVGVALELGQDAFVLDEEWTVLRTLEAGSQLTLGLTFTPQLQGEHFGLLDVLSNDPAHSALEVSLYGIGGEPAGDADGDGWSPGLDCDDQDPEIHPEAEDPCDAQDNDCDGQLDEDGWVTWYPDADKDGYGGETGQYQACDGLPGDVRKGGDCDDQDAQVHPGLVDDCDGLDTDCDGKWDEDGWQTFYTDGDGDGFGDPTRSDLACTPTSSQVSLGTDCNDEDPDIFPGADELCDQLDNDCDQQVDESGATYYPDADQDGYGDSSQPTARCAPVAGEVTQGGDCDDHAAAIHPGATELCDSIDQNCDGDASSPRPGAWYADSDGDGWGDPGTQTDPCAVPEGYVDNGDDNCPAIANPDQADIDEDGWGDVCIPLEESDDLVEQNVTLRWQALVAEGASGILSAEGTSSQAAEGDAWLQVTVSGGRAVRLRYEALEGTYLNLAGSSLIRLALQGTGDEDLQTGGLLRAIVLEDQAGRTFTLTSRLNAFPGYGQTWSWLELPLSESADWQAQDGGLVPEEVVAVELQLEANLDSFAVALDGVSFR